MLVLGLLVIAATQRVGATSLPPASQAIVGNVRVQALSSTLVSTIQRFVAIIVSAFFFATTPVPRLVSAGIALAACGCVVYALSEAPQQRKATKMKTG